MGFDGTWSGALALIHWLGRWSGEAEAIRSEDGMVTFKLYTYTGRSRRTHILEPGDFVTRGGSRGEFHCRSAT